jgi:hypothetical protein
MRLDDPWFGAEAICDERQQAEGFGHSAWVDCFKSIAYRTFPVRVLFVAWPWLVGCAAVGAIGIVKTRRSKAATGDADATGA